MEISDTEIVTKESVSEGKKKKAKKRPSDFEIFRTIFQRTTERKLPFLLKNLGEDSDILFLCSQDEEGFTFGSPDMAIGIFEITDPELKTIVDTYLTKMHGYNTVNDQQCVICIRDQISELAKTKGETFSEEITSDDYGSSWCIKRDVRGQERTQYYSKAIDSLFHMQSIKTWCATYRPLLTTDNPSYVYQPYRHPEGKTSTVLTIASNDTAHPMHNLYPHGFRNMATRGLDVILDKFLEEFPYPIEQQDIVVFKSPQSTACQMAHRIQAKGWRMILVRPNAVFFPTLDISAYDTGNHSL